ncbi:hypothetical protein RHO14_06890 [Orbus wheelerorum]|uniref:hypothetical protein n=1 Tax=Orbus wheelerorum TaxID=3074111 RepID=UPI00370D85B3
MQIQETKQDYELRIHRLNHAKSLLSMINDNRIKARAVFDNLKAGQQKYLLLASGINRDVSDSTQLNDVEIEKLYRGLIRIKSILVAFKFCNEDDFKTKSNTEQVA